MEMCYVCICDPHGTGIQRDGDMSDSIPEHSLNKLRTFGKLLRFLRMRAGLTQTELSIAVGCSDAQISRLEQDQRLPNVAAVEARFVPALSLRREPAARDRLLRLAEDALRKKADMIVDEYPTPAERTKSIAVLPFKDLTADADNEYFCDGLAEELLSALAKIRGLFVVARASAFSFKGKDLDVREIGQRLGVDTLLEGSVKKSGPRLRISVQLINAANGFQIWSERFERRMTDLFELQDEITLAIISELKVELLETDKQELVRRHLSDLEAYNLYLKGRFYWAQRPQGINKAIEFFQLAIDRDPQSALPRAGLADCYATLGSWENGSLPPIIAMAKARTAANKAVELDERLAEPHATLAYRTTHHDWDWSIAEAQFRHALALNPNYAVTHHWYSHYLMAMGRTEESLAASTRCLELDPLDLVINIHMAWHYQFSRRYDEAVDQCHKTNDLLHPNSFWPPYFFAMAYQQQGRLADAATEFQKAIEMSGSVTFTSAGLGHLYGCAGDSAKARRIFEELYRRSQRTYVPAYDLALVCVGLGWTDQAFEWLDKAYQERSGWLTYLRVEPRLDSLRMDARFGEMLHRLRLGR
jgi:TolB-like protein/DNA-binding XRE family transcriptional regulator